VYHFRHFPSLFLNFIEIYELREVHLDVNTFIIFLPTFDRNTFSSDKYLAKTKQKIMYVSV